MGEYASLQTGYTFETVGGKSVNIAAEFAHEGPNARYVGIVDDRPVGYDYLGNVLTKMPSREAKELRILVREAQPEGVVSNKTIVEFCDESSTFLDRAIRTGTVTRPDLTSARVDWALRASYCLRKLGDSFRIEGDDQ